MTQLKLFDEKMCASCGRYFVVTARIGERQKCCRSAACEKKRKRMRDKVWRRKNPEYFLGRYEVVKSWRLAHPGYQKRGRVTFSKGPILNTAKAILFQSLESLQSAKQLRLVV